MADKIQGGVKAGSTAVSLTATLKKTTDSTEQTGKVAADMTLSYYRQGASAVVAVAAANLAALGDAHSDGGVKEISASGLPGEYRIDWPDAAFALGGADWVDLAVKVAGCFLYRERVALQLRTAFDAVLLIATDVIDSLSGIGTTTNQVFDVVTNSGVVLTGAYDFAKGTVAMTESYAANGAAPTPIQLLYGVQQTVQMHGPISGTDWPVYKLNGLTVAFHMTLNDGDNPTSAKRL